jgi:hypothetical protein
MLASNDEIRCIYIDIINPNRNSLKKTIFKNAKNPNRNYVTFLYIGIHISFMFFTRAPTVRGCCKSEVLWPLIRY